MREIKFRGKATVPHEDMGWVYGSLVIGPVFNSIHFTTSQGPQSVLVDWRGIGQYTGLKDKNGTEIYEGDVVEAFYFKDYYSGLVKYDDELAGFYIWFPEQKVTLPVYASHETQKVIGNVFDDPELKERFWAVWNQENNE